MNLTLLSVKMMLNTSARWLESEEFRAQLKAAGGLGESILDELEGKHDTLAELSYKRSAAHERVRALIELCTKFDQTHDRMGRGLYFFFDGLIQTSNDEQEIARYRELKALLFPIGLRVLRLPYIEEGGAAVELERAVGAEARKQLAAVPVGSQTLEQVFDAWIEAGHQLGEAVRQRAELQASLGREGSAADGIDLRVGRRGWLQAVRGLLWAIEIRPELRKMEEPVTAALAAGIKTELRRRSSEGGGGEEVDEVLEVEAEEVEQVEQVEQADTVAGD